MNSELLNILSSRFEKNMHRHKGMDWNDVQTRIVGNAKAMNALQQMEATGGEPDVVGWDETSGRYIFMDCCAETPVGRRNLCYDEQALKARKENKPTGSAMEMANDMGIAMLDETDYRHLQDLEPFDCKTSSWLYTPEAIRKHGGAIFGDRRYQHVFIYHNGVQSYYAVRGFRGKLLI